MKIVILGSQWKRKLKQSGKNNAFLHLFRLLTESDRAHNEDIGLVDKVAQIVWSKSFQYNCSTYLIHLTHSLLSIAASS